jgi:AraC-like DNA-binding protein
MIENFVTTVLLAMTIGVALVCIGFVIRGCVAEAKWPSHSVALAFFFVVMTAESSEMLNQGLPNKLRLSWLYGTTLLLVPSLGVCIWLYIRGVTSQISRFERRDVWHVVPIAICIIGALPYLALSKNQQTAIMTPGTDLLDPAFLIPVLFLLLAWITWIAILILYGSASMSRLIKHRKQVRDLFSELESVSLKWLQSLIIIVGTFTLLVITSSIFPVISNADLFSGEVVAGFYFFVVFVVGLFGVLQKNTIPTWNELGLKQQPNRKYARSALQIADMERIASKLDVAMQSNRFWQNPSLSLIDMAAETRVSQNNISQTLNDHLSVNFYDYVNGWRIKAACDALRTTDLTVVTISEDVGFNAKSTFNASFKKITGQTPRQYRASVTELQATSVK